MGTIRDHHWIQNSEIKFLFTKKNPSSECLKELAILLNHYYNPWTCTTFSKAIFQVPNYIWFACTSYKIRGTLKTMKRNSMNHEIRQPTTTSIWIFFFYFIWLLLRVGRPLFFLGLKSNLRPQCVEGVNNCSLKLSLKMLLAWPKWTLLYFLKSWWQIAQPILNVYDLIPKS